MNTNNTKSADSVHIEDSASENNFKDVSPKQRMGDVKLLQNNGETVLVPTPSPDPNGELVRKKPKSPSEAASQTRSRSDEHPLQTPSTSPPPASSCWTTWRSSDSSWR